MFELAIILFITTAISIELLLIVLCLYNFKGYKSSLEHYPSVDILVAARNEEENIENCLDSLLKLDYPRSKLHIWVGDDASTDSTWQLIESYTNKYTHIKGVKITNHIINGNGKANVLAQLAYKSQSEWIFMTDADIQVSNKWIEAMIAAAVQEQAVLVTGTSLVVGSGWLANFQKFDWLNATIMLKVVSDIAMPITGIGNNMGITRKVYNEVGGFEKLPFSVTEDLELFKQVKKTQKTLHVFSSYVLNKSAPQESITKLLLQRKRWMRGAFQLPFHFLVILILQALYLPTICIAIVLNPAIGLSLWIIQWLLKYTLARIAIKKLGEKISLLSSFFSEWVLILFSFVSIFYYFCSRKIYWKNREY